MPFDIASLRTFEPAQYQCEKCLALLKYWDEVINTTRNRNPHLPNLPRGVSAD
jgi:hypothetical protein